jgi:hypothetical protein
MHPTSERQDSPATDYRTLLLGRASDEHARSASTRVKSVPDQGDCRGPPFLHLASARIVQPQDVEKLTDLVIALRWVPHGRAEIERVVVPPSLTLAGHIAGLDEVRDDPLRRSLRDPHRLSDVAQTRTRVAL